MHFIPFRTLGIAACCLTYGFGAHAAGTNDEDRLRQVVDAAIRPLMKENDIPGLALAISIKGERYVFNYGVASKESGQKITNDTLFEIGSVSKTFTAVLASYAQVSGKLSFSDMATKYMPELAGSSFDKISLLELGTYTAGGLPLQFPKEVTDQDKMVAYYRNWRPSYAPGSFRQYSNASIGLFGYLAARAVGEPFDTLMQDKILVGLGLRHTYIHVPAAEMRNYAYGYSKQSKPIRVSAGVLDAQAYGIKTTASDMLSVLETNMDSSRLRDGILQRAIVETHIGHYSVGNMTQALGWESYAYPTTLARLLGGNSSDMALEPHKTEPLNSPKQQNKEILLNKTGSTGGFGAYAVFIPARQTAIVLLANKNYPNPERVKAAYKILTAIGKMEGTGTAP